MRRKPLDERCSLCTTGSHGLYRMQDRFLNLRASDMLKYLELHNRDIAEKRKEITDGDISGLIEKETVGNVLHQVVDGVHKKDGRHGACHQDTIPPLLYLLLIEPFAQWMTETGYIPDNEFLTRTGIVGLSISRTGEIPFLNMKPCEDAYDYDIPWN